LREENAREQRKVIPYPTRHQNDFNQNNIEQEDTDDSFED
jgi:hypothetical protein